MFGKYALYKIRETLMQQQIEDDILGEVEGKINIEANGNVCKMVISEDISRDLCCELMENDEKKYKVLYEMPTILLWDLKKGTYYVINMRNCTYYIVFHTDSICILERATKSFTEEEELVYKTSLPTWPESKEKKYYHDRMVRILKEDGDYDYRSVKHVLDGGSYQYKSYGRYNSVNTLTELEALEAVKSIIGNLEKIDDIEKYIDLEDFKKYFSENFESGLQQKKS